VFWVKREENGGITIRDRRGGDEQVAPNHSRRQDNLSSHSGGERVCYASKTDEEVSAIP